MHNLKKSMFSTVQLVGKFAVNFWCCKSLINVLSWCQTKCRKRLWIFFGFIAEIPYTSSQYSTIPNSHENFIHLRLTPYYYNNVHANFLYGPVVDNLDLTCVTLMTSSDTLVLQRDYSVTHNFQGIEATPIRLRQYSRLSIYFESLSVYCVAN